MAVLEKIRVKLGIFISILIAVALLSFIVDPTTLQTAFRMISSENKVGEMDGKAISYQDFYEKYNYYTELAKILGQNDSGEEAQSQLRDAAWQSLFDEMVFEPKAKAAGISVGEQEMLDLTQGNSISPVLANQAMFIDENGNFSREALVAFVQSIESDESGYSASYWNYLEESIYTNQLYSKYASLIEKSVVTAGAEKARSMKDNNITVDVDYVLAPISFVEDSTNRVTSAEIRDWYNSHKENYRQLANRDLEYVMWEVVPSAEDIAETRSQFDDIYEEFKIADNLKNFITVNSDNKYDTYYYTADQLESVPEIAEMVAQDLPISEVHVEATSFSAARIADVKTMSDSAHVYYAAFPIAETEKADSLAAVAQKGMTEDFTELGWLTQDIVLANGLSDFTPVFDMDGKVTVIKSTANQANFVVYVAEKTKPVKKYQIATLTKNVLASDDTYRDFQMTATEVADASEGKYEKFSQIVKEKDLPVIPINNITEATRRVGVVDNARELVRWAFEKGTKEGSVSDLITVDNKYYFVAAVTGVHKEGIAPVEEVASYIRTDLAAEKNLASKEAEVASKVSGMTSMDAVAEALDKTVSNRSGLSFGNMMVGLQDDPGFVGAAMVAPEGQVTIAKGTSGIYVFKVSNKSEGSFYTDDDVKTMEARLGQYQSSIIQNLMADEAKIKDYRARFF